MAGPSYLNFDSKSYAWRADVDYRQHPEAYRVGKGEQGVLICEPYKSEIGPLWRFKTPDVARDSSARILRLFLDFVDAEDFVGADMARKYLQMGFTRARRYANYKSGRKYDAANNYEPINRQPQDEEKAAAAAIFREAWQKAEAVPWYKAAKKRWKSEHG